MEKQTGERYAGSLGRPTSLVAVAGLAGLAATLALTTSVLIGAVSAATDPDSGSADEQSRASAPADSAGYPDDYGIRCLLVGWCAMPPGQPQPVGAQGAVERGILAAAKVPTDGRLDDYGIRCQAVGWCALPPGSEQRSSSSSADAAGLSEAG